MLPSGSLSVAVSSSPIFGTESDSSTAPGSSTLRIVTETATEVVSVVSVSEESSSAVTVTS